MNTKHLLFVLLGCLLFTTQGFSTLAANKLSIPVIETGAGKEASIPVYLTNESEIVAVQFKLQLPVGFIMSDTTFIQLSDRKVNHTVTVKNIGNNTYLFVVFSMTNTPLRGNSGALLKFPILIPDTCVELSEHPFALNQVILSVASGANVLSSVQQGSIRIVSMPRPDVSIRNVESSQQEWMPGTKTTISWVVQNVGDLSTSDGWSEQILLVAENGQTAALGTAYYNQLLAPGAVVARQAEFVLSAWPGLDGAAKIVVKLIPNAKLGELPAAMTNNTATSAVSIVFNKLLTLKILRDRLGENNPSPIQCQLFRSGNRETEQTFSLVSSDPGRVSVPPTVTIPMQNSGAVFYLYSIDNQVVNLDSLVVITASGNDYADVSDTIQLDDNEIPSFTVTPSKAELNEGEQFTLTIEREIITAAAQKVSLSCNFPKRFTLPAEVIIPANQKSVLVTVEVVDDALPALRVEPVFTVSALNYIQGVCSIFLNDNDIPKITLSIKPDTVTESSGYMAAIGVVKRLGPTNSVLTIKLTDDSDNQLYYSNTIVQLEAGIAEKQFTIGVVDNVLVDGNKTIAVKASVYISSCSCSATGTSDGVVLSNITVLDDDGPALKIGSSQAMLPEGKTNATLLTITRNTEANQALTVNLSSDRPEMLVFESSVVIPAGAVSASVPVSVLSNDVSEGNQTITFTAAAEGFALGRCWAMITDQTLADAKVEITSLSKNTAFAKDTIQLQLLISNNGFATLRAGNMVNVYLSKDSVLTSGSAKLFVKTLYTARDIVPNTSSSLSKSVILPDLTGSWFVYAEVNPTQTVLELSYLDNMSKAAPLQLNPGYLVTVASDKQVYKTGEPIWLSGQILSQGSAGTAGATADVYLINEGSRQSITATADATGAYRIKFEPFTGQIGHFIVGACYPGVAATEEQTSFDIYGLKRSSSGYIVWEVLTNEPTTGEIELVNPGNLPLTNLVTTVLSDSTGWQLSFDPIPLIGAGAKVPLTFRLNGLRASTSTGYEPIQIHVASAEGAELDLTAYYYCRSAQASLQSNISTIQTTMTKGSTRTYQFTVKNVGKGATGKISVLIPKNNWLSLLTPAELPSMTTGQSTTVTLQFAPGEDMPVNVPVTGTIGVNCENGSGIPLSFNIETVSDRTGTLLVDVCDEYTYYTAEAPHVAGASVTVKHPFTNAVIAQGFTNEQGVFTMENLPEGYYSLVVSANKHDVYSNNILIDPGRITKTIVNLSFQAITYSWNVVETEVEDVYEIVTTATYETNVPVPVVEVKYPDDLPYKSQIFKIYVTNKGLINASRVTVNTPTMEGVTFEMLTENPIPTLAPQQSMEIAVRMTVANEDATTYTGRGTTSGSTGGGEGTPGDGSSGSSSDGSGSGSDGTGTDGTGTDGTGTDGTGGDGTGGDGTGTDGTGSDGTGTDGTGTDGSGSGSGTGTGSTGCFYLYFTTQWYWYCGEWKWAETNTSYKYGECPQSSGGSWGGYYGGGLGSPGGWGGGSYSGSSNTPVVNIAKGCDDCKNKVINVLTNCIIDVPIMSCWLSSYQCGEKIAQGNMTGADLADCTLTVVSCAAELCTMGTNAAALVDPSGTAATANITCRVVGFVAKTLSCLKALLEPCDSMKLPPVGLRSAGLRSAGTLSYLEEFQNHAQVGYRQLNAQQNMIREFFGSDDWNVCSVEEFTSLVNYLHKWAPNEMVDVADSLLQTLRPAAITSDLFAAFIERYNATTRVANGGSPEGENYMRQSIINSELAVIKQCETDAAALGFSSVKNLMEVEFASLNENLNTYSNSVCSTISLQFSQTMTMTRQAFRGTLTVFNGHETTMMQNVELNLTVTDSEGNVAGSQLFQINTESVNKLTAVDGTGILDAQETGTATILFIPTKFAAPTVPKDYAFGGTLSYLDPFTGTMVTRDLYPVTLTVKPSPDLVLTYFMQRDVLGDDALTLDVVEPMEPAEFTLLIKNQGAGDGTNIKMTTSQPKIIDNEKGLLIDFSLIGSSMNGAETNFGVTDVNFGTIPAGGTTYAQWWFTSTLLGHFVDYDIKMTHVTSYGNPDLSLVSDVTIHELIRSMMALSADSMPITGFLANDLADAEDLPDMLYVSDGSQKEVSIASGASWNPTGNNTFVLTVNTQKPGWHYGVLSDPGNGRQTLKSVVRMRDQASMSLRNFWQTDRTLRDGRDPLYENRLHFVDLMTQATETYLLTFEPRRELVLQVVSMDSIPTDISKTPVTQLKVAFNKPVDVSTFTAADMKLTCQGKPLDVSQILISTVSDSVFNLVLTPLTTGNGYYVMSVQASDIMDMDGYKGENGKSAGWNQYLGGDVQMTLLVTPANSGHVTPASGPFAYGSSVDFTAVPANGYHFSHWTKKDVRISNATTLKQPITEEQVLVAVFTPDNCLVTIVNDAAKGSVVGASTGIVTVGTVLQITATPTADYAFEGWKVNNVFTQTSEPLSITIAGVTTIEAVYAYVKLDIVKTLGQGWNWISSNLTEANLLEPLQLLSSVNLKTLKVVGFDSELVKDPFYGFVGGLSQLKPIESYKLKVSDVCEWKVKGTPIVASAVSGSLFKGWNWIGYLPSGVLTPDVALAEIQAETNDVIKDQQDFSVFDGNVWVGTLETLSPGNGYMYHSESNKALRYPTSPPSRLAAPTLRSTRAAVSMAWSVNRYKYPSTMNIVAKLFAENKAEVSGLYSVGAFVGNECRGVGKLVDGKIFLTVYGSETGEVLTFRAFNNESGELMAVHETTAFGDALVGSLDKPFEWHISGQWTSLANRDMDVRIYPNPVKACLKLEGVDLKVSEVRILSMDGKLLYMSNAYVREQGIDVSTLLDGTYLLTLITDVGTLHRKFIKMGGTK